MPEQITINARPMRALPTGDAVTDIIIPFHGRYEKVSRLVDSLLKSPTSNPYHICLVDDGSPNADFIGEIQELKVPYLTAIRLENQVGFGGALNAGIQATQHPFIVSMHSDCVVENTNWLRSLLDSYASMRGNGVKMVSARSNNPINGDPRLKATRTSLGSDMIIQAEKLEDIVEKDMYLPFFCSLFHRDLFRYTGGLLRSYPIAMYEDVEFACRMLSKKFYQGISGISYVYHEGGCTMDYVSQTNKNAVKIMDNNFNKLRRDLKSLNLS